MESYGTELKETPYPLIAALGSRELQSKVLQYVRTINEEFVPKLHFTSLPIEHRFPIKKEIREKHGTFPNQTQRDFDGYHVAGILKTRWLKKHHELIPAVVLLFHEFDPRWNQKEWMTQETTMKEEIDQLKKGLTGRECRIVLLLVQQVDDVGIAPINLVEERLIALRKRLETDSKGLLLLRSRDIVRGSNVLSKLESMIRNYSLEYYKAQSKRVKRYKKVLNKTTHLALHVRHSFKIAHYYEFRRYTTKVLQHYEAAYRAVMVLPLNETDTRSQTISFVQIKTMAEYINFKLCYHLIFSSSNIKAAVEQLHRHIKAYGHAMGPVERSFEHWEWVSRQYHVFAQLLSEAVSIRGTLPSVGLDSDVYKEPYLYYAVAAKYATFRRKAAAKLGLVDPNAASTAPITAIGALPVFEGSQAFSVLPSPYVGGDASVSEINSPEPAYGSFVKYRYALERTVPHAKKATLLLEQAIHHLSLYISDQKAPRNRLKSRLLVQLGMERLACNDLERARAELQKAKLTFGAEHWWPQMAQILKQLVICTFKQGDITTFMDYSLQLLSPVLEEHVNAVERIQIQDDFEWAWKDPTHLGASFTTKLEVGPSGLHEIILDHTRPLFDIQVHFDRVSACVRDDVWILVAIHSYFPSRITMTKLDLVFSDERYNMTVYHRDTVIATDPSNNSGIMFDSEEKKWLASLEFDPTVMPKLFRIPVRVREGRDLLRYQEARFYYTGQTPPYSKPDEASEQMPMLLFVLPYERRVTKTPKPYLVGGRVPVMGKGPGSPSFARRKSMFSMAELAASGRSTGASTTMDQQPLDSGAGTDFTEDDTGKRSLALAILQPRAKASLEFVTKHVLLTGDFRVLHFKLRAKEDTLKSPTFRIVSEYTPPSSSPTDALFFMEDGGGSAIVGTSRNGNGQLIPVPLNASAQPRDRTSLHDMEPHTEETFSVIVRSMKAMNIRLIVHVMYSTKSGVQVTLEERFDIVCKDPFSLSRGFIHDYPNSVLVSLAGIGTNDSTAKESYAVVGKNVSLHGNLECESVESLRIVSMVFDQEEKSLTKGTIVTSGFGTLDSHSDSHVVKKNDMRSFYLRMLPCQATPFVSLGSVTIRWRRLSSIVPTNEDNPNDLVTTKYPIPTVSFVDAPLTISLKTPSFGVTGSVLVMEIHVKNNENVFHSVRIKPIDDTGEFLVSGRTNIVDDILPLDSYIFRIHLIPTKPGYLRIPQLEITSITYNIPFANSTERRELLVFPTESASWKVA